MHTSSLGPRTGPTSARRARRRSVDSLTLSLLALPATVLGAAADLALLAAVLPDAGPPPRLLAVRRRVLGS